MLLCEKKLLIGFNFLYAKKIKIPGKCLTGTAGNTGICSDHQLMCCLVCTDKKKSRSTWAPGIWAQDPFLCIGVLALIHTWSAANLHSTCFNKMADHFSQSGAQIPSWIFLPSTGKAAH